MKIFMLLFFPFCLLAQTTDQPLEQKDGNKIIVTCPELIHPKFELHNDWSSKPCVAKFKALSPNEKGGPIDLVQCYYSYMCGASNFTIDKKFPKYTCKFVKERSVECTRL